MKLTSKQNIQNKTGKKRRTQKDEKQFVFFKKVENADLHKYILNKIMTAHE